MSFEDEMDVLPEEHDGVQSSCDATDGMTPAEAVAAIQRESLDNYLQFGLPYDPDDPDIPRVQRQG
ncbi:MAG: hypothetical protein PHO20_00240 [Candidatus Peribacteraceae bacterium]|nr:hypothetical protein [Candidatus Peribacteraceae bacterium]MDD5739186.1 hypothetical protein [Candidatus Peribacteraceae bacterium]